MTELARTKGASLAIGSRSDSAIDILRSFEMSLDKPGNYIRVARQYLDYCLDERFDIGRISYDAFIKTKPSIKYVLARFIKFCRDEDITSFSGPTKVTFAKTHFESELIKKFIESKTDLQGKSSTTFITGLNQYFRSIKASSAFVGRESLDSFKAELKGNDLSKFTINSYLGAAKQFCKWLSTQSEMIKAVAGQLEEIQGGELRDIQDKLLSDLIAADQVKLISGLYSNEGEQYKDTLSEAERERIYLLIDNDTDRALYALMAWSGLRISEASEVRTEGINLERNLLTVKGKGDKTRTVHILGRAKEAIRALPLKEEKVFTGMDSGKARKAMNKWFKVAGVKTKKITPHSLRHTAATVMLSKGVGLEFIRQQLGHSKLEMTLRYVARLNQLQFLETVPEVLG